MPPRTYIDLRVELGDLNPQTGQFHVLVSSEVGETPQPAVVPACSGPVTQNTLIPDCTGQLAAPLDDLTNKRISQTDLLRFGALLGEWLLPMGPARDLYGRARAKAGRAGGVRLRLIIRSPQLEQLPWEYAYLQTDDGPSDPRNFLALDPQVSIVRHQPQVQDVAPLAAEASQLQMIAATANVAGFPQLQLDVEERVVHDALKDLTVDGVTVSLAPFLSDATPDDLATALLRKCDLFHFAGHGVFSEGINLQTMQPNGVGCIVLEKDKETRAPALVPADDIARLLQSAGARVAVFGACESARVDGVTAWSGVAPALAARGIPAVIAMQYQVVDSAALAFSRQFYQALAAGLSVDEAVWAGRDAMHRVDLDNNAEWGVPVLYLRSTDGILFPKLTARDAPTAQQIRKLFEQRIDELDGARAIALKATKIGAGTSVEVHQDIRVVKDGAEAIGAQVEEL